MKIFNRNIGLDKARRNKISDGVETALHGGFLTSSFFKRNFFYVLMAVGLLLANISVRYDCTTAMENISSLRTQLEVVRTQLQSERSSYMSSTRESAMQTNVDSLRLGLSIQQRPPFHPEENLSSSHHTRP